MSAARFVLVCAVGVAAIAACSTPQTDARVVETAPPRESFGPVADMLVHRCGTLDCHGSIHRNLRLFGRDGLRLASSASPSFLPGAETTTAEHDEDYQSVIGLEPEIMTSVVASGGAAPERLTLVRKGRGSEDHKGGSQMSAGDDRDVCLTSWLAGHTDDAACARALQDAPLP